MWSKVLLCDSQKLFTCKRKRVRFCTVESAVKFQDNEFGACNERPWQTRTHCCRHKCFPVCRRAQHLLRTQILCPGHEKCHVFCSETIFVHKKCFPVCAAWKHNIHVVSRVFAGARNIMSNNVSTFARALKQT